MLKTKQTTTFSLQTSFIDPLTHQLPVNPNLYSLQRVESLTIVCIDKKQIERDDSQKINQEISPSEKKRKHIFYWCQFFGNIFFIIQGW